MLWFLLKPYRSGENFLVTKGSTYLKRILSKAFKMCGNTLIGREELERRRFWRKFGAICNVRTF